MDIFANDVKWNQQELEFMFKEFVAHDFFLYRNDTGMWCVGDLQLLNSEAEESVEQHDVILKK
jgi:hypothetical protein